MMEQKYFKEGIDRYVTKGVNEEISPLLQYILWTMIENAKEEIELDYFQIFELDFQDSGKSITKSEQDKRIQIIKHSQEQPEYSKTYEIPVKETIKCKIWVIDDGGGYATMLFPEEY